MRNGCDVAAKWSIPVAKSQKEAIKIYRLSLATSFDDFLLHLEQAAASISKPNTMAIQDITQNILKWANTTRLICTHVGLNRILSGNRVPRFLDACFAIFLFSTSCCSLAIRKPLVGKGDVGMDGCMMMSFSLCGLLRQFASIKLALDDEMLAFDTDPSLASCNLVLKTRRSVVYEYLHTTCAPASNPAHTCGHVFLIIALGLSLPDELVSSLPAMVRAGYGLPGVKSRSDASKLSEFLKGLRAAKLEACLGCGMSQNLAAESKSEYRLCSACGFAT